MSFATLLLMQALIAHPLFIDDLKSEIAQKKYKIRLQGESIFLIDSPNTQEWIWAQGIWTEAQVIPIESIKKAADVIRQKSTKSYAYPTKLHRRCALIEAETKRLRLKERIDLMAPLQNYTAWTLLDTQELLIGNYQGPQFPNGAVEFIEDKVQPPSRAYLKLWEFFTRQQWVPNRKQICVDLGSCPGGWTWALAQHTKTVISIDGAPLHDKILKLPQVQFHKADAFQIDPKKFAQVDCVFSDIIADTKKIAELALRWVEESQAKNFVFTLKFKGKTDFQSIEWLQSKVPQSKVQHLWHNKHEVTWSKIKRE